MSYFVRYRLKGKQTRFVLGRTTEMAASVFGGIQPAKLEQYLFEMQQGNGNDGFVQRFQLMVFPDEVEITTVVDEHPDKAAEDRVMDLVTELAHGDFGTRRTVRPRRPGVRSRLASCVGNGHAEGSATRL
jgi:hypothetical protein